jgi:hypothetical protein
MGSGSSPLSCRVFLPLLLLPAFPLLIARRVPLLLPSAGLLWGISPLSLFGAQGVPPALFARCLFCCYCLLFRVFFPFSLGGGWSVHGAVLIWPRIVCGSTSCHLAHLVVRVFPSHLGCCCLAAAQEPSWFLHLMGSGDAMRRLEVWRSQRFASSWWFFL